jgi:SSS family solute:Na+ symporter
MISMRPSFLGRVRGAAAVLVLLCGGSLAPSTAVAADPLTPMHDQPLPALPATGSLQAPIVFSLDERPIVLATGSAWQLSANGERWTAVPAPAIPTESVVLQAVGDGGRAWLLLGDAAGRATQVTEIRRAGERLEARPVAALPAPLAQARIAARAGKLAVAGSLPDGSAVLLRLDPDVVPAAWTSHAGWPGGAAPATLAIQTGDVHLTVATGDGREHLLRFRADQGWSDRGVLPGRSVAAAVRPTGQAHLLYVLQDAGGTQVSSYQTITGSWARMAPLEAESVVAAGAWKDGLLLARAGPAGGLVVSSAQLEARKLLLGWLDWGVIVVYLGAMLGIGLYFYLREKRGSTADFFVGGRSIPFWAAGISLYATNTSSISFIAIPAKAFETNWQYLTNNLTAVFGLMFVAVWIVPVLRRLDLMSVFSYLETRFHPAIRMMASALCILMQIGSRMSVILFLPALAIATITGLDVVWSILIMGGFTIVYTALGGMKAVIWTDFAQMFVMMGGALFAIGFIILQLDGGVAEFVATAATEDKTKLLDFSFDLTKATVWGFIFLVLFDVVLTFPKDQVLMQRVLSTRSAKEAGRSVWAMAAIMIPGGFVFYGIGTALWVYYKAHPERMNPLLSIDATFPLFIAAELPMGITGLIIAGIFAAAMSTLSSIINSVATLASVDFYEKLAKAPTPAGSVRFAEWVTVAVGLVGIGIALLLSTYDIHSLFDLSIELAGLLGGGFAGAYTLGMFTRRANSQGVAIGIASSIVLTLVAWSMDLVHPYFYLAISIMLCIVIGYAASLLFPAPTRSLVGLTIYNQETEQHQVPGS